MVVVSLVFQQQVWVKIWIKQNRLLVAIRAVGSSSANGQRCRKTQTQQKFSLSLSLSKGGKSACTFSGSSLRKLEKHRREVHPRLSGMENNKRTKLNNQIKRELLQCDNCKYKTARQCNLKMHIKNHLKYTCTECGFPGSSQKMLMKHKRKVHLKVKAIGKYRTSTKRRPEDCPLPDKSKFLNWDLQKCDMCEYKSAKFYNMRVHIRKVHFDLKHKCAECDFSHLFLSMVKKHFQRIHLKIWRKKKLIAPKMNKEAPISPFVLVSALLEEVLKNIASIHTRKLQRCKDCSYSTKRVSSLRQHAMKHNTKAKNEEASKKKNEKILKKREKEREKSNQGSWEKNQEIGERKVEGGRS